MAKKLDQAVVEGQDAVLPADMTDEEIADIFDITEEDGDVENFTVEEYEEKHGEGSFATKLLSKYQSTVLSGGEKHRENNTSLGNPVLDAANVSAVPGSLFIIHGDRGAGKTAMCANIAQMFIHRHKMEGQTCKVLWFDTENGLEMDRLVTWSNPEGYTPVKQEWIDECLEVYSPATNVQAASLTFIQRKIYETVGLFDGDDGDSEDTLNTPAQDGKKTKKLFTVAALAKDINSRIKGGKKSKKEIVPVLVIIDSYVGVDCSQEVRTLEAVDQMADPKLRLIGSFFKQLKMISPLLKITTIMTEWDATNFDAANKYSPKTKASGAKSVKYYANIIVDIKVSYAGRITMRVDGEEEVIGTVLQVHVDKSRLSRTFAKYPQVLLFINGVSKGGSFKHYAVSHWTANVADEIRKHLPEFFRSEFIPEKEATRCMENSSHLKRLLPMMIKNHQTVMGAKVRAAREAGDSAEEDRLMKELYATYLGMQNVCVHIAQAVELEILDNQDSVF